MNTEAVVHEVEAQTNYREANATILGCLVCVYGMYSKCRIAYSTWINRPVLHLHVILLQNNKIVVNVKLSVLIMWNQRTMPLLKLHLLVRSRLNETISWRCAS